MFLTLQERKKEKKNLSYALILKRKKWKILFRTESPKKQKRPINWKKNDSYRQNLEKKKSAPEQRNSSNSKKIKILNFFSWKKVILEFTIRCVHHNFFHVVLYLIIKNKKNTPLFPIYFNIIICCISKLTKEEKNMKKMMKLPISFSLFHYFSLPWFLSLSLTKNLFLLEPLFFFHHIEFTDVIN